MRPVAAIVLSALTALAVAAAAPAARAQDQIQVPSPILTIDQERLFAETRLGARSARAVEAEAAALAEENRDIESSLRDEERALTDQRGTIPAAEFTALADAFDDKVRRIRAEQDAKARAIAERQEAARQNFFFEIGGVLSEIVQERGAVMILDRRDIFLSADWIDITDVAIDRINAAADLPEPPPEGGGDQ